MSEYTINMPEYDIPDPYPGNIIHPTAVIGPNVIMGTGNYIGPHCIIGYPAEHKAYWDKPLGNVIIGHNNKFTGLVTIDAGTEKDTTIFSNCWFLKHSHVGHDAVIHDDVTVSCGAKIGGHAIIHAHCNIGLNASVHQWIHLPEGCMVGMNACVTKKTMLYPFTKYVGVPAKSIGPNNIQARKSYLRPNLNVHEGDTIFFEMPPMCSGEYSAQVFRDERGLYIHTEEDFFGSCYDFRINKPYWNV